MNKRRRISIVDDDPSVLRALDRLCSAARYVAETHQSAEAFLAADRGYDTDCLILDVQLPGRSGLQLQSELRAADQAGNLRLIGTWLRKRRGAVLGSFHRAGQGSAVERCQRRTHSGRSL